MAYVPSRDSVRKSLGDWAKALRNKDSARLKAMDTAVGSQGGYLLPRSVAFNVDRILEETCVFHRYASRFPMETQTVFIPSYDLNASHAAGDSPLYGGMGLRWGTEGTALVEVDPSFAGGELVAKNLQGTITVTDQLVADGGAVLGAILERGFAAAIRWFVERACFRGQPGGPQGVVTSPASVAVTRAGGSHVAAADLSKMLSKLLPACYENSIWCYHPSAIEDIAKLSNYQVNQPQGGSAQVILGRLAFPTEKLPSIGNPGDVVLFDPTQYALGEHQIEVAYAPSIHVSTYNKRQGQFRIIWRGDGQFLAKGTATLEDGSSVCGVSVVLT